MSRPQRPRAKYEDSAYKKVRVKRLEHDYGLCVFCKQPAGTVQHVTYRHAGGGERLQELRALCKLCHDACTMIEYGRNLGMDRIDPCDLSWRDEIIRARDEIRRWRSESTRRRALRRATPHQRRELLDQED
jgi:formate hydrogenlyase subunit 6/NADH:ubiquinone oxidoreductase subunit I